jgi:hypothetical protein
MTALYKLYAITDAYYIIGEDVIKIKGIPSYGMKYYGEYVAQYPYEAATKACTGIYKYMKKYHNTGTGGWYPGYQPDKPPDIVFNLENVETEQNQRYHCSRIPAHQGARVITGNKGRTRHYKWDNKVTKLT